MTALETLIRARDILVKLRDESTPGPYEALNAGDVFGPLGGVNRAGTRAFEKDGWQIADFCTGITITEEDYEEELPHAEQMANRALFLTLHAALPALIQVLDEAIELDGEITGMYSGHIVRAVLALAEAVIGVAG